MTLRYKLYAACHIGKLREHQEDAIALPMVENIRPADVVVEASKRCWAVVADGMGGHAAGDVASELSVAMLASALDKIGSVEQIGACLKMVNHELRASAARHPQFEGMGTTVVGAVIEGDQCVFFNMGDSRAYTYNSDVLQQVSQDQCEDAYVTGFLGGSGEPAEDPYFAVERLVSNSMVVLCSDGLNKMISDTKIRSILAGKHAQPAKALVDAAVAAGGFDNVSVVVVICEPTSNI